MDIIIILGITGNSMSGLLCAISFSNRVMLLNVSLPFDSAMARL